MNKHYKLLAVLSTAAAMSAATPALALSIPGSVSTVLAATAGWLNEDGELRYKDSEGYYLTDSWKKKDGEWYYLNEDGFISRSSKIDEYYVNEEGRRVMNQWVSEANEDEWDSEAPDTYWYYYGKDGRSVISKWQEIDGKNYYFNDEGHMQTGMLELDGATYYLGEEGDGVRKTGWIELENEDEDLDQDSVWHFFDNNGRMVVNQIDRKINGSYYTFQNGILQTGWFRLPETAQTQDTAADADAGNATASNADTASNENNSGSAATQAAPAIAPTSSMRRTENAETAGTRWKARRRSAKTAKPLSSILKMAVHTTRKTAYRSLP